MTTSSPDKVLILLTLDFDAVSALLGTGQHPSNNLNDYSSGLFSARVGVPRLLALLARLHLARHTTWFLPGHSIESFPARCRAIVASGAEIALHGYCHEGAGQLTPRQQRDVLERCIHVAQALTGVRPRGYRAPLYQLDETTLALLAELGFAYDASLTAHDSRLYRLPANPVPRIAAPRYAEMEAAQWMRPLDGACMRPDAARRSVVEIPSNWYGEDATPLQYYPYNPATQGYVPVTRVEAMWKDRLEFLLNDDDLAGHAGAAEGTTGTVEEAWDEESRKSPRVFNLTLHPDVSGMSHIIGMLERFLRWVKTLEDEGRVQFCTCSEAVEMFRQAGG